MAYIIDITKLVDDRNREIYNQVKESINLSIQISSKGEYLCYSEGKNSTIFIPKKKYNINYFTHELLHAGLRVKHMYAASNFNIQVNQNSKLRALFDERLIEHVGI